jgi:carbon monoxide dehydrogenase subunit G
MDMQGEARIPASQAVVWDALNDPEALKTSITGCEELTRDGENAFAAKVRAKVGPVSARFAGKVQLVDIDAPNGYRIQGEGTGGAAGFAKGGATVQLESVGPNETLLKYDVTANVGGKLAQIGARLVDGAARKMADEFFQKFSEVSAARAVGVSAAPNEALSSAFAVEAVAPIIAVATPAPAAPAPEIVTATEMVTQYVTATPTEAAPVIEEAVTRPPEQVASSVKAEVAETVAAESTRPLPRPNPSGGAPAFMWVAGIGMVVAIVLYALF